VTTILSREDLALRRLLDAMVDLRDGNFRRRLLTTDEGLVGEIATVFNDIAERNQQLVGVLGQMRDELGHVTVGSGAEGNGTGNGNARPSGNGRNGDASWTVFADAPGGWADAESAMNDLADGLLRPTTELGRVLAAVAEGDLTQRMSGDSKHYGDFAGLSATVNGLLDQLSLFASEVTRVAREIGTEGRLGGQAQVPGVAGIWRELTDSVNFMAADLTGQVRDISRVATAVAMGDLGQKITVEVSGEMLELKTTINTMVDQLSAFADEVTRVAREVGSDGRLGGQADVPGAAGTWRGLTDSVNQMAGNLTSQVRNIAQVATAVAMGDLSQKIDVDARGEILELKNTLNTMVDQLSAFADEVTRVAREVGSEGRLGGQAQVPGVAGTWRDLTDSVNFMAGNLTSQVRSIAQVTTAVARGDLTQMINVDARGEILELKNTINTMVDRLSAFADEVTRVAREVGTEGKLGGQARVPRVAGTWKDLTDNVNVMAENLTSQVRSIATVATAVAGGDLSKKITVEAKGEVAALAETINTMVDRLSAFADEVTRVAREVGTDGILGGQARVPSVAGTWKDLTDNVNVMAGNLTSQVRNIAQVTTAVAQGDLSKKIDVDARGEILELKSTINTMVDQLSGFADEVTRVAREVGTEGKLGGQAEVIGVSGTWQRLTESVNRLAGNLTTQVRAIAAVATAVTAGDLTRQITVDASGEVAELKDNINQMIANLHETTKMNEEQDWLKTNLARISGLMQGRRDLSAVASMILSELAPLVSAQYGAFFLARANADARDVLLERTASYGAQPLEGARQFELGEALVGQAAVDKRTVLVTGAPPDYIKVVSGLGATAPVNVIVLPVAFEDQTLGVIELASVRDFTPMHKDLLEQLKETIAVNVNTILANSRTESLLAESQRLAEELRARSEQLESSNTEQAEKARLLAAQNRDIEIKNIEIERARQELEERAKQLTMASRYKSEFLANMSHELRTPLNSALILAKLLADNLEGNLTAKQVEFARTIFSAGSDLLQLINDVLDLAKVEAGRMELQPVEVSIDALVRHVDSLYRTHAEEKGLEFSVTVSSAVPPTMETDQHRLQQILRNLLSNAVKFTNHGRVELLVELVAPDEADAPVLGESAELVAFSVHDTGIGIPSDKLTVIFEAFQQADGTTNRRYGGTGLGLSISRELTRLLGGDLRVRSEPGSGSTFTLYLPMTMGEWTIPENEDVPEATGDMMPQGLPAGAAEFTQIEAAQLSELAERIDGVDADIPDVRTAEAERAESEAKARMLPKAEPAGPAESKARPVRFSGERVLIVDDDLRNVFALSTLLESHGLEVVFADSGIAGIRALEQYEDITLVLMDVMMPEMDGNETIAAIREMPPPYAELPIIAVTAKAMKGDQEKSLASGATDYVTKPVDTDHLMNLIRTWVRGAGSVNPPQSRADCQADPDCDADEAAPAPCAEVDAESMNGTVPDAMSGDLAPADVSAEEGDDPESGPER
jgi:signal transduction histidine kinase/HAMP domain-containing protein/DNA-binding NarL/FixJ family response regulator